MRTWKFASIIDVVAKMLFTNGQDIELVLRNNQYFRCIRLCDDESIEYMGQYVHVKELWEAKRGL